ncbi:MAG: ribosome small subunit-dependent GTPase A [Crocinitomicaceae bacterium]|nr:ribosome small subunit-dependent GTPase A [Crocinitomicaceae bacterium]MBT6030219.1 ribosome small subunit-dependent GTPase A [Crocinitomicaceae bacterium]MBT6515341.1 ribosome small subunit-dependent GTPase A [Crocinitomicaceae bacterium]MDG2331528.1 ribosome small subunit-dependent GTPase A [Flavobacteriales bacterium]
MEKGLVIRSTGSWYEVRLTDGTVSQCRIQGKFRIQGIKSTNPIAVGDWVDFNKEEDGTGVIRAIHDRRNYIIRKSVNLSKRSHIIASNIDQAILIITIDSPRTSTGFIDRFLVSAEAYRIPVALVFNKIDLLDVKSKEQLVKLIKTYREVGYETYEVSALNRTGVAAIKNLMKDKVSLVSGHSGVGKSTLINAVDSNLELKTGEISEAHYKGKHTTTFAEMFELNFGGFIVDTPGIKGFGIVDIEKKELGHYFPEIRALMGDCKFNNCQHLKEPKCAVIQAVENGKLPVERYTNYLAIYEDNEEETYRDKGY